MKIIKLKPFDLKAAEAGAKVVTRNGYPVRIICTDFKNLRFPILGLVSIGEHESIDSFTVEGRWSDEGDSVKDLFMAPTKRQGWVNICDWLGGVEAGKIYSTEEEARAHSTEGMSIIERYVDTVPVEWEE